MLSRETRISIHEVESSEMGFDGGAGIQMRKMIGGQVRESENELTTPTVAVGFISSLCGSVDPT